MQNPENSMIIDGCAASQAIDKSSERLIVKGADISDYTSGMAYLTLEHRDPKLSENQVGKIIYAKKIYAAADCEDERQLMFYNQLKLPYIYIRARLFDAAQHPQAVAIASQIRDSAYHNEPLLPKFSVEGKVLQRDGHNLTATVLRFLTVTLAPCNGSAVAGVLQDPNAPKGFKTDYREDEQDEQSYLDDLIGENTSKAFDIPQDFRVEGGMGAPLTLKGVELAKAIEAGNGNVAPSNLVGGSALATESLAKKREKIQDLTKRAAAVFRDWDKLSDIAPILKHNLPDADEGLLNHFKDLADDVKLGGGISKYLQKMEDIVNDLKKVQKEENTVLSAPLHGDHTYNILPEQHELIHGLDLSQKVPQNIQYDGTQTGGWVKHPTTGKVAYVKQDDAPNDHFGQAAREGAFNNISRHFFGMASHMPNVAVFTPSDSQYKHTAIEKLENAHHKDPSSHEDHNKLKELHQSGTLDKLAAIDTILGNADRHRGNWLLSNDSAGIKMIDHGGTFDSPGALAPSYHPFAKESTPHPSLYPWLKGFRVSDLKRQLADNNVPPTETEHVIKRFLNLKNELKTNNQRPLSDILHNAGKS